MKLITTITAIAVAFTLVTATAQEIGKPAPAFMATNLKGEKVSLADLAGKVVVLEWTNFECPFVKKHYESGNMPKLQADYQAKDVVWITVNSSAEGKQGYNESTAMGKVATTNGHKAAHFVLDTDGTIGKAYAAKVTPHMFIINKESVLDYDGAVDSKPTPDKADVETADKLFVNALDATLAGIAVVNAKNQPYGCGVKY